MIGYVKGEVVTKGEDFLVVSTGGVGYEVFVDDEVLRRVEKGDETELFIWTYLRQDTLELYGCPSQNEMEFFRFLTKVSGIGPKLALSLARYGSPAKLKSEIEEKGSDFAKEVKGLGKKKLKRLLLELTGKVEELKKGGLSQERLEAVEGLKALGFGAKKAKKVVKEAPPELKDPEAIVEEALKMIGEGDKGS